MLAQYTLCVQLTERLGIRFVHMTDRERFGYRPGGYAHQYYLAAGWGEWEDLPRALPSGK